MIWCPALIRIIPHRKTQFAKNIFCVNLKPELIESNTAATCRARKLGIIFWTFQALVLTATIPDVSDRLVPMIPHPLVPSKAAGVPIRSLRLDELEIRQIGEQRDSDEQASHDYDEQQEDLEDYPLFVADAPKANKDAVQETTAQLEHHGTRSIPFVSRNYVLLSRDRKRPVIRSTVGFCVHRQPRPLPGDNWTRVPGPRAVQTNNMAADVETFFEAAVSIARQAGEVGDFSWCFIQDAFIFIFSAIWVHALTRKGWLSRWKWARSIKLDGFRIFFALVFVRLWEKHSTEKKLFKPKSVSRIWLPKRTRKSKNWSLGNWRNGSPLTGTVHKLTRSLPGVIHFKFPLQPHQESYITLYGELGFSWLNYMKDDYATKFSLLHLYISLLESWENVPQRVSSKSAFSQPFREGTLFIGGGGWAGVSEGRGHQWNFGVMGEGQGF